MEVRRTAEFDRWLAGLRDIRAQSRIGNRLERLISGNLGDVRSVGSGVSEIRIDYGPGYRLYFIRQRSAVLFLNGGDKSSQDRDILHAKALATLLRESL